MENLITLNPGLSVGYSNRIILSLPENYPAINIKCGRIYGIGGANGIGKTTLLNLLNGFICPASGYLTYYNNNGNNFNISKKTYKPNSTPVKIANISNGIRRIFQIPALPEELNITEAIILSRRYFNEETFFSFINPPKCIRRILNKENVQLLKRISEIHQLLDTLGMFQHEKRVSELSYGEKRIITLVQLLFSGASLLIMDEPFANVNTTIIRKIKLLLMNKIKTSNSAVIIVEHKKENLEDLVDEIWYLKNGRISIEKSNNGN